MTPEGIDRLSILIVLLLAITVWALIAAYRFKVAEEEKTFRFNTEVRAKFGEFGALPEFDEDDEDSERLRPNPRVVTNIEGMGVTQTVREEFQPYPTRPIKDNPQA